MSNMKWSSLILSYTRCLLVLLILQTAQILGDEDKFNIGYTWIHQDIRNVGIPANAVQGGYESNGPAIYVGRGVIADNLLPAKVVPHYNGAFIDYNHTECFTNVVDVLVRNSGKFEWEEASNGYVPPNAVVGGNTVGGEILYIGRADYAGSKTVGKIQPSDRCLYITYHGDEILFYAYEVLVYNPDY